MIKNRLVFVAVLFVFCSTAVTACFYSSDFRNLRSGLEEQLAPLKLNSVFSFAFGSISLSLIRNIARHSEDGDETSEYLKNIDKIQIGVYEVTAETKKYKAGNLDKVVQGMTKKGWELFVRVREHDERVLVFYKMKKDLIKSLSCVVLSEGELVVVDIKGDLDKIIQKALDENGVKLDKVIGSCS